MYISPFVLGIIIVVLVFVILKKKSKGQGDSVEDLQLEAEKYRKLALEEIVQGQDSKFVIDKDTKIKLMSNDLVRLTERFKHDQGKLKQIFIDWRDYCCLWNQYKNNYEMSVFGGVHDGEEHYEIVIKLTEIEKRFEDLLDKDS